MAAPLAAELISKVKWQAWPVKCKPYSPYRYYATSMLVLWQNNVPEGKTHISNKPLVFQEQDKRADVHNILLSDNSLPEDCRRTESVVWAVFVRFPRIFGWYRTEHKFSTIGVFKNTDTGKYISEICLSSWIQMREMFNTDFVGINDSGDND
jgi:hypothetical protein